MRLASVKIILTCMLSALSVTGVRGNNDGLYFNSHSYTPAKRTTLMLNNGNPIEINDRFKMSFYMELRGDESLFGNIFCINTNDGKHIDATLSGVNKPVLVIDGKLHYIDSDVTAGKNIKVEIAFDKKNGRISYDFGGHKIAVPADLSHTSSAVIFFGMHLNDANYVDVAPMNVRDISIFYGDKNKYFWNLRQHNASVCNDNISDAPATATNGRWILDSHVKWETLFTYESKDKTQVTYNPRDNIFYIVDSKTVRCYDPSTKTLRNVSVRGGYRAMTYSNYIAYSENGPGLYTYNMKENLISSFNFATGQWSNDRNITEEPEEFNHSWARANDSVAYMFGGYGFYKYKNSLWQLNTGNGEIRRLNYSPKIGPRTGAASVVVGDWLYIFGGYGNATGEQELPCSYYYDLTRINLKTLKADTVWTYEGEQQNTSFLLASEMIYNSEDSTFYAATTYKSGRLIKISMKEPGWKIVTEGMDKNWDYKDLTFDMYSNTDAGKLYVVIDRRMNNLKHNIRIYSIDLPIQDDYMTKENATQKSDCKSWWWLLLLIIPAGVATTVAIRRKRKGTTPQPAAPTTSSSAENAVAATTGEESTTKAYDVVAAGDKQTATDSKDTTTGGNATTPAIETTQDDEHEDKEELPSRYYNPTGGYISLLGKFVVHDRNGEDITSLFTRRTRNLLLMLLLHSERNSKGIEIHILDEALWQEMNDESARNNRNVYMRKLRVLLEKIGNVEIVNDKIHYRMKVGEDVFFDYREALAMMNNMENDDSEETRARTLELLFEGPLLPNYSFEWLDKFKAEYSNAVISLLTHQMRREQKNGNDNMAMKIAKTILLHDPFSDNALATQCAILCRRHKKGIAKNVYDNFCKNYEASIGEKYHISFAELCK